MKSFADTTSSSILIGMARKGRAGSSIALDSDELANVNIGQELVRFRSLNGRSESEVAEALGISKNYVRLIEWGLVRNVSPKLRQRILELVEDE